MKLRAKVEEHIQVCNFQHVTTHGGHCDLHIILQFLFIPEVKSVHEQINQQDERASMHTGD